MVKERPIEGRVRLRIDLAYDGAPFWGFARQPEHETVQGRLEVALSRIFGQDMSVVCAGRTDKGVHARGQVVHGDLATDIETSRGRRRTPALLADLDSARHNLDRAVGDEITVWSVRQVSADFHARFSAKGRHYRYRIIDAPTMDPLTRHHAWHARGGPLDVRAMQRGAKLLLGEQDFASFCRNRDKKTTMRRLLKTAITRTTPELVEIRLEGNAFCHQQVRAMVGCLVEVGRGEYEPEWIGEVLAAKDRSVAAAVAPAHGLVLESVRYGRGFPPSPIR